MKTYTIIAYLLFFISFIYSESWSMTINANDINQEGSSDYIILGMCNNCNDSFQFSEDEFDLPSPPGYHTDISFFNFDWLGIEYGDPPSSVTEPEFYIDKRSFHDPVDLLVWNINGFTNLPNENSLIEISWSLN